jgi:hypothetical protein
VFYVFFFSLSFNYCEISQNVTLALAIFMHTDMNFYVLPLQAVGAGSFTGTAAAASAAAIR